MAKTVCVCYEFPLEHSKLPLGSLSIEVRSGSTVSIQSKKRWPSVFVSLLTIGKKFCKQIFELQNRCLSGRSENKFTENLNFNHRPKPAGRVWLCGDRKRQTIVNAAWNKRGHYVYKGASYPLLQHYTSCSPLDWWVVGKYAERVKMVFVLIFLRWDSFCWMSYP